MAKKSSILINRYNGGSTGEKKLKERFNRLANEWIRETRYISSVNQIIMHPAYLKIIGMGPAAIPLILKQMKRKPGLWFWALKYITDEDPITEDILGDVDAMTQAWLNWGHRHGY